LLALLQIYIHRGNRSFIGLYTGGLVPPWKAKSANMKEKRQRPSVGDLHLKRVTALRAKKTRKRRQTFWRGCFPHHFKSEMTIDDANSFGAHLEWDDDLIEDPSSDPATSRASQ
jgi:hypothetical protein